MTEPAFKLAVGRLAKQSASIQKIVLDATEKMITRGRLRKRNLKYAKRLVGSPFSQTMVFENPY